MGVLPKNFLVVATVREGASAQRGLVPGFDRCRTSAALKAR